MLGPAYALRPPVVIWYGLTPFLRHYRIFHTTGTAGCLGAAAAVAKLLSLSCEDTISALGTAGTQAAGLWEFASDAAMSKQVHTAHAASVGLMSAYTAKDGLLGAKDILLGNRGLAKGTAFGQEDGAALVYRLGQAWKVTETSFKVCLLKPFAYFLGLYPAMVS